MAETPASEYKSVATETAALLTQADGFGAVTLLQQLGLLGNARQPASPPPERRDWVGIWRPQTKDGETHYVRAEQARGEWQFWADVQKIPPKNGRCRIALVGESVARGYLYDPDYTPAGVLSHLLSDDDRDVEVVDLARTDLLFSSQLPELAEAATKLEPDLLVVFAGNNYVLSLEDFTGPAVPGLLRSGGVPALKTFFEKRVAEDVENVVDRLARLGCPVVFLIPEFNLGDWHNDESADVPWLPGEDVSRWLEHLQAARDALADDRLDEVEQHAEEMIQLDQGTAATGLQLLAECRRRQNQPAALRSLLERARDAHSLWDPLLHTRIPSPHHLVQQTVREHADRAGITCIDLRELLTEDAALPDRKLFIDYCHLTSEGIRTVMSETARVITSLLFDRDQPRADFLQRAPKPAAHLEGQARVAAAIHNAHCGQSSDVLRYHCERGLEASPAMADVMHDYIELQTLQAAPWMSQAAESIMGLGVPTLVRYLLRHNSSKSLDSALLSAMSEAMENVRPSACHELRQLQVQQHAIREDCAVNLLDPFFAPSWVDRDWNREGGSQGAGYFRASSPVSHFTFVSERRSVLLTLTCRLGDNSTADGSCRVLVNRGYVKEIRLTKEWMTCQLMVPEAEIREGVNDVTVCWPTQMSSADGAMERAARQAERGLCPDLVPVFGSVHTLTAAASGQQST